MPIRRAHHTGFTVANLERSLEFYRDVLGLEVVGEQLGTAEYLASVTGFPGLRLKMAFVRAPGDDHVLELLEYVSHPSDPTPRETNRIGNGHLGFVVDDAARWYDDLRAKGVEFTSPGPVTITAGINRGGQAAYFRDPDGFTLELFQPPRPSDE